MKGNFANKGDSYSKAESDGRYFGKSGGEIFGDLTLQKNARRHIRFHNGAKIDGYIYKDPDGHMMFNNGVHGGDWQMRTDGSFYCGGHGNFSGEVRAPSLITGAVNNQSYFFQHEGVWRWTVQQGGTWKGEIQHPGRGGVFALQGDSYTKGESDGKYQPKGDYAINQNVVPNSRKINGKALSSDMTLNAADVGAFPIGATNSVKGENGVPWNAASGAYRIHRAGDSVLVVHFNINSGSTPALQLKTMYKNNGIAYRSARDSYGFEEPWTEFYTTKNKPSASDVDAYSKGESDNKYQLKGNLATKGESYTKGESDGRYFGKSGGEISGNFTLKSAARRHIIFNNGTKVDGYIYKDPDGHLMFNNGVHGGDWQMRTDGSFYCGGHGNFSGEIRSPNVITGAINNQSYFFQHEGIWRWTVQQGGTWKGEIQHPGRGGVFALQGDSYTKGESDGKYQPKGNFATKGESYTKGESDGRYLPKSGGTLSGALTVNNNIRANTLTLTTSSSSWINMRSGHCLTSTGIVNNAAAAPIVRQEHTDRHFMVAGLGNLQFGFYMLNKGRKDNGVDAAAYLASDGSWYCNGNGNFNDVYIRSDKRAKNDIQKISDAGKKLSKLSGYTYTVSDDNKNSSRSAGLIAQEVQKVLPEAVTQDENDLLRLNYNSVIGLLVEAVKDLQKQVDELTKNR
nr:tail fiber domain-containing protein [Xenorhabdus sp. KJ12.1]